MSEDVCIPVFVLAWDCGEVTEYSSLTAMQGYMEAVDVEGNEYDAWDGEGFVVRLTVSTPSRRGCELAGRTVGCWSKSSQN